MDRSIADVVVVGAGIVGLSVAWQIRRRSDLRVVVVDKAANVAEGSTGASSAILRYRYSHDETIRLARDGVAAYRNWQAFTGLESPRMTARETGVLWMLGDTPDQVDAWIGRMRRLGVDAERLDGAGVAERFPALSVCGRPFDLSGEVEHECGADDAFLFEPTGGYADPVGAAQDLRDALTAADVEVRFRSEVVGVRSSGATATGVDLADGSTIDAPMIVNAAGPWSPRLFAMAGLDLPWDLVPTRAQVVYRAGPVRGPLPVVADASTGIYLRPEGDAQILFGSVREEDEQEAVDPDDFVRNADAAFRDRLIHALHHRIPGLEHRGTLTGLAGLYTVNRDDVHPLIGPTDLDGFVVATGFSGHGFKEAPAAGALVARLITGEADDFDTDAPIEFFSLGRDPIHLDDKAVLA